MARWKETKCRKCKIQRSKPICNSCRDYNKFLPMTNVDRIHSMNIEELAEFIINNCDNPVSENNEDMCDYCEKYEDKAAKCDKESCKKAIVNWLQSEVEE